MINPTTFSHTSVAILDVLKAAALPVFKMHISNIHVRENFRRQSYVSAMATSIIAGSGTQGYDSALEHAAQLLGLRRYPHPANPGSNLVATSGASTGG